MHYQQNRLKILERKVLIMQKIVTLLCDIIRLTLMHFTFVTVPSGSSLKYSMYSYLV